MRDSWRHFTAEFIGIFALVFFASLAVATRGIGSIVCRRMLARAFAIWRADTALGPTISGDILAELAEFNPDQASRARDWLLDKGKRQGMRPPET